MPVRSRLQIRSNSFLLYNQYSGSGSNAIKGEMPDNFEKHNPYSGCITDGVKKRLTNAIENMAINVKRKHVIDPKRDYESKNFQLSFATFTIPVESQVVDIKECYKKCFSKMLQWYRRQTDCNMYVWKAEYQERGQLHYHIISDAYIQCELLNRKWNSLLIKAGYMNEFIAKHGHDNPPSSSIEEWRNYSDIAGYLKKEFGKIYQNPKSVNGKIWDCSLNLKKHKRVTVDGNDYRNYFAQKCTTGDLQIVFQNDHCTMYRTTYTAQFNRIPSRMLLHWWDKMLFDENVKDFWSGKYLKPERKKSAEYVPYFPPDKPPKQKAKHVQFDMFSLS